MSDVSIKGNFVELKTFKSWGEDFIKWMHFKTEETDGKVHVKFVQCKLCSRYADHIINNPKLRGAARASLSSYINGTNAVQKSNMRRHLCGKAHALALEIFNEQESDSTVGKSISNECEPPSMKRPRTSTSSIDQEIKTTYYNVMKTAYQLAANSMHFRDFKVLIKVLKENGVNLPVRRDCHQVAQDLVNCLSDTIKSRLDEILITQKAFSSLCGEVHADKNGANKKLVFIQVEREGAPVTYCYGLEDLEDHRGSNVEGLKKAHDRIFNRINKDIYCQGMTSAATNAPIRDLSEQRDFLAKMADDGRPWLLQLHCFNHQSDALVKSVFCEIKEFVEIEELYVGIRCLLQKLGRLRRKLQKFCYTHDIHYYPVYKLHDTRFQHHRRKGFKRLLDMWMPLLVIFENALCKPSQYSPETLEVIADHAEKLKRFDMMCNLSLYFNILEYIGTLASMFEKPTLLATEVEPARDKAMGFLGNLMDLEYDENNLSSHFRLFNEGQGEFSVNRSIPLKECHGENGQDMMFVTLSTPVTHADGIINKLNSLKQRVIPELKANYLDHFDIFKNSVIEAMMVIDPKHWDPTDKSYGNQEISFLSGYFASCLSLLGFNKDKVISEWQSFRRLASHWYRKHDVHTLWSQVFLFRKAEFPNLCKLTSVLISICVSNRVVEKGFSALTNALSDRRSLLDHRSLEALLIVQNNHHSWLNEERKDIIASATDLYLERVLAVQLHSTTIIDLPLHASDLTTNRQVVDKLSCSSFSSDSEYNCDRWTENENSFAQSDASDNDDNPQTIMGTN